MRRPIPRISRRTARSLLIAWVASQLALGTWISWQPLAVGVRAVHDVTPLVGTYLRLKAEGKI